MAVPAALRKLPEAFETTGPDAAELPPDAPTPAPEPGKARSGSEQRKRQHVVRMRLDDDELVQIEARAGNSGLTVGAFLRACALETAGPRARRRAPVDRELLAHTNADLNRVGNNLNQIARALNRGQADAPSVIEAATDELRHVLVKLRQALGYDRQG
jgi:hypothetical protein